MRIIREWLHRLRDTLSPRRTDGDLQEELRGHLELAADEARRRDPAEKDHSRVTRMRAGGIAQAMDALRDQRGLPWLDALGSDVVLAWRNLGKRRAASVAAILSLGLAIGATTAAFRLIDAVLLRPLPVAEPERLYYVATGLADAQNRIDYREREYFDYPTFRRYSAIVSEQADLMVVGMNSRQPFFFGTSEEPERAYRQYVSGNVFPIFGLQPALGRLLTHGDDVSPGGHPVAVISHDYWTRRFGGDPAVVGQTFRFGNHHFEIVGVSPAGFTGTEPGRITDVFLPAMMNVQAIDSPGWVWFRLWVRPRPGVGAEPIRQMLQAVFREEQAARANALPQDIAPERIDALLSEEVLLVPARAGASTTQTEYRRPAMIVTAMVALVLVIAIANVANLLTAQAMARGREMAVRVSLGAGRWRLIRLVLVESAVLAVLASAAGTAFAWWSAPVVASMLAPPEDPVRLVLDMDWRVLIFSALLTAAVAALFGLAPAFHASAVKPMAILRGGDNPHARRRLMHALVAAQVAFCICVLFVAGLLIATFARLSSHPLGFTHERLLVLPTSVRGKAQTPEMWGLVAEHLRQMPGVQAVSFAGWALLSDNGWTVDIRVPGGRVETVSAHALNVAPGFFETMNIPFLGGRDFRLAEAPGVAIVNDAFARTYFNGRNPIGRLVSAEMGTGERLLSIVGWVRDATYRTVREQIRPTVYVPIAARGDGSFVVRTSGEPLLLASTLRDAVSEARPEFVARAVETQSALVRRQMVRERLLAALSVFFALTALLLAAIGLYGVLNYRVMRERRDIGIRMALGARAAHVVRHVSTRTLALVGVGSALGLAAGVACGRFLDLLLFNVTITDRVVLVAPMVIMAATAVLAALPPTIRAVRTDPAQTLRAE